MVNRRFMRQFITFTVACGLMALIVWPYSVEASVDIVFFRAVSAQNKITLEWETESELDFLGFRIFRSLTDDFDEAVPITPLIPAQAPPGGGSSYSYDDTDVVNNVIYYYWLGSFDIDAGSTPSYEGPISASTLGGTTISTPVPTSQGSSSATATHTPTSSPTTSGTTTTPVPTTRATNTTASPTVTPQPSPTIDLTPSRIPAGTFPQPPTPTRFTFNATATPGAQVTSAANGGSSTTPGNGEVSTGSGSGTTVSEPPPNELTTPVAPVTPLDELGTPAITDLPGNPGNGVDVIGQADVLGPDPGSSADLLPPPGAVTTEPGQERTFSPLLMMGLLVGGVFTFGGALTTLFIVARKR